MLLKNKSTYVAYGGILTALAVLFMYISSLIPAGKLALVFLASAVIGAGVNISGIKLGAAVYAASAVLSFFIVSEKNYAVLYVAVAGNYPLVKPLLERIRRISLRVAVKLIVFNLYMLLCAFIGVKLLSLSLDAYPFGILWLVMLMAFFVYDYAYSLFMQKIYYALPKNNI